ncbi:hypothetical protein [Brevundimonas lenta]|uniref:Transporter n=1 Tax=Brevundimonas lenta TaxID=424796 RepID=A0A7W6JEE4_9CAUL|nr:hypothetical protein [Brevundimonas lenta]MBB4083618.1 hypothetical protein [Brevundimonas lenta]
MRAAGLLVGVVLLAGPLAGEARAQDQDPDPSARYDIDDILGRLPHDPDELPTQEEARGRAITFEFSLDGTYTTNAATSRFDTIDAVYVTPAFGINVTPVTWGGWDIGGGAQIDADYYAGGHDDDFGEGRLEGFVFAQHALGPGQFTAEFILLGIFGNDFSDQDLTLRISDLTYSVSGEHLNVEISAEYQDSDIAELRRSRWTATASHVLSEPIWGHEVTIEGDLAVSDFTSGASSGRNDATAGVVLIAQRSLGRGWDLEWEGAFINRFSNREASRFTALELGVELTRQF